MDVIEIGGQALAVGLITKAVVDVYRRSPIPSPWWALPTVAFGLSVIGAGALGYAYDDLPLDGKLVVRSVILAFLATVAAILTTEIHEAARKGEPRPDETLIDKAVDVVTPAEGPEI